MKAIVLRDLGDGVPVGGVTEVTNPRRYNSLLQQNKITPYEPPKAGRPAKGKEEKENGE